MRNYLRERGMMRPALSLRSCACLAVVAAGFSGARVSRAATFTWNGLGANNFWSTNQNWLGSVKPPNDGTASIIFAGSTRPAPSPDVAWSVAGMTFDPTAAPFDIGGGPPITVLGGGITNNNSANTQRIDNSLIVGSSQTWLAVQGTLTVNGGIALGNNTLTVDGLAAMSMNGVVSGNGGLIKTGAGTLTLGGTSANTYTGNTTVNSGTLLLGKSGAANATISGPNSFPGSILTIGNGTGPATVRLLGQDQINDYIATTINAGGVLDINGFSDYLSPITLNGGTIQTGSGFITLSGQGNGTTADITTLATATTAVMSGKVTLNGNGTFNVSSGSTASGIDLDLSAVCSAGSITKNGTGTTRLIGINTFAGGTTLNAGTLAIGSDSALGTGTLTINGGSIQADTSAHVLSNAVNLASTLSVAGNVNLTLNGVVSGTGGLTKSGTGTLTLGGSSANTFTGTVNVNDGAILLNKTNSLVVAALNIGDGIGTPGSANVTGLTGYFSPNVAVTIKSDGVLTFGSAPLNGIGSLSMTGGSVSTPLAFFYLFGNVASLASSSTAAISAAGGGGVSLASGASQTVFTVAQGTTNNGIDLDISASLLEGLSPPSSSVVKSGPGTIRLSGNNTFTAGLTLNSGTIAIGSDTALGTGTLTVNGGTIQADTSAHALSNPINLASTLLVAGNLNLTLNGVISGTGGLTKSGTGTLTLGGNSANTFSGPVNVNDGTLVLSKPDSTQAISGTLNIGDGIGAPGSAIVTFGVVSAYQLPESPFAAIAIKPDGILLVGPNSADVFGAVVMNGGTVTTTGNSLYYLGGDITTQASGSTAMLSGMGGYIYGNGSSPRTFMVAQGTTASGIDLDVSVPLLDAGASGIVKAGQGTMRISGNSTFTGGVTLNAGTLAIGNDNALGTGTLTADGGTIQADTAPRTITNPIILASTLTVTGSVNLTLNGVISGTNGLIKNGTSTLTLGGATANSFAGPVVVNDGTLLLSKPISTQAASANLIIGDGIGLPGSAVVTETQAYQLGSPRNITVNSDGLLTFGPNATDLLNLAGTLTMNGGTIATAGSGGFAYLGGAVISLANSSTATISTGYWPIAIGFTNGASQVTFTVAKGTTANGIDLNLAADFVNFQSTISSIVKNGPGTLRLSSGNPLGNEYSGGVTVNAGTVLIGSDTALGMPANGGTATLTLNGGAVAADTPGHTLNNPVNVTADSSISGTNNLTFIGPVTLTGNHILTVTNTAATVIGGPISGTATLTKNGAGSLALSGANTFTGPLMINAGSLALSGGSLAADVINSDTFVYNGGLFSGRLFNAGTLALNADFTAGNGMENDSGVTLLAPRTLTLNGAGLDNEGTIILSGDTLKLTGTTNVNRGTINLPNGGPLNLDSATLTNSGSMILNSSLVSGATGSLVNTFGGTISGAGTITSAFNNSGGLIVVGSFGNGALNITHAFTNSGAIQLVAATASVGGGAIANSGTINGLGNIGNAVTNTGTIEALGGILNVSGTLQNQTAGLLRATQGNKLLVIAGLTTNAGTITLSGGEFDNNSHTLNNTGQITGYGTLSSGGLTNNGSITLTGGTTTVNGDVTNSSGKSIFVKFNPAIFTGNITNLGTIKTTNTTVVFTGTYTGNAYTSDPSTNIFQADVTVIPGGSMTGGIGDQFEMSGGTFINNGTFDNGGLLQTSDPVSNAGSFTQTGSLIESGNFTNSGSTTIGAALNWSPGTTFTNTAGSAIFQTDAGTTGDSLSVVLTAGSVSFASTQHLAGLTIGTGATATITGGGIGHRSVLFIPALSATGTLDLTNNDLDIQAGGSAGLATLTGLIQRGFSNGTWTGTGITSSSAARDASHLTAVGVILNTTYTTLDSAAVSINDVLAKTTYYGDANLDGNVDGSDYSRIDSGLLTHTTGWSNGDFNYDGVVNGSDYTLIDNAFNTQGAALTSQIAEVTSQIAYSGSSAVPEPTTLGLLGIGAMGLLGRRARRN